jgi:hypothetical protein
MMMNIHPQRLHEYSLGMQWRPTTLQLCSLGGARTPVSTPTHHAAVASGVLFQGAESIPLVVARAKFAQVTDACQ